jgi:hypothetical protein
MGNQQPQLQRGKVVKAAGTYVRELVRVLSKRSPRVRVPKKDIRLARPTDLKAISDEDAVWDCASDHAPAPNIANKLVDN